ncbi:unnamed protein product [Lepeophtheirus salmonis]|uniref:(salmon louse) hypothetical protein n=1 Tax=Lepeophtheirus salmonis TaxID=72036 RepID=A0A7R8HAY0_LEPSM|nr:unnamed protein product [Lepeophtheirus salmonis]CAF2973202.1 unnamed protein product [Lepeophtheirus salmonis]
MGPNPPSTTLQSSGDKDDIETSTPKYFFGLELQQIYAALSKLVKNSKVEIVTDFFEVRCKEYLAIVDPYSNFLLAHKFPSAPTCKALISSILQHFVTFDRPLTIFKTEDFNLEEQKHKTSSLSEHIDLSGGAARIQKYTAWTWLTVPSQIVFRRPTRSRLPAPNLSLAKDEQERLNEQNCHIAKQHEYARNHYNKTANQLRSSIMKSTMEGFERELVCLLHFKC